MTDLTHDLGLIETVGSTRSILSNRDLLDDVRCICLDTPASEDLAESTLAYLGQDDVVADLALSSRAQSKIFFARSHLLGLSQRNLCITEHICLFQ